MDNIPLAKKEIQNFFSLKHRNNDSSVITKTPNSSWHKHKTKPVKADMTTPENEPLLQSFRKLNTTMINENTDLMKISLS